MKLLTNAIFIFLFLAMIDANAQEPIPERHVSWMNFIHFNGHDYLEPDQKERLCISQDDVEKVIGVIQHSFGHGERPKPNSEINIYAPYYSKGTKLYKIKDVDTLNYIAVQHSDTQYVIFRWKENEKSLDYIRSLDKIYKEKEEKQKKNY